jgi:hypothetical protein
MRDFRSNARLLEAVHWEDTLQIIVNIMKCLKRMDVLTLVMWTAMMLVEFVQRPYGWWEGEEEGDYGDDGFAVKRHCCSIGFSRYIIV